MDNGSLAIFIHVLWIGFCLSCGVCVMYCNVMDGWKDVQMPCRFTITPDCTKCALMRRGTVYIYSIQYTDMGSGYCTHSWMEQ